MIELTKYPDLLLACTHLTYIRYWHRTTEKDIERFMEMDGFKVLRDRYYEAAARLLDHYATIPFTSPDEAMVSRAVEFYANFYISNSENINVDDEVNELKWHLSVLLPICVPNWIGQPPQWPIGTNAIGFLDDIEKGINSLRGIDEASDESK